MVQLRQENDPSGRFFDFIKYLTIFFRYANISVLIIKIKQMAYSQYVNLKNVLDFVEGEIKEISERWGRFNISKNALERALSEKVVSEEERKIYDDVFVALLTKKEKQKDYYLDNLDVDTFNTYKSVEKHLDYEASLENAIKQIKEVEEFLETATKFRDSILK